MADGAGPDWPSLVTAALAVGSAVVAVVMWVPRTIAASRHKQMGDLQPKFASIDEDIEKHGDRLSGLETRVAVLEAARRTRGGD